ncbi:hypothetical protein TNCV_3277601 [Trichonephila clavipes]|nr:hypothetical protein TNCV_3277601 [Trichonephila clavipes]
MYHHLANLKRSISALKRVKAEMRSTTEEEKLNSLMLLCTQNDITMEIDYNDVINDFAMIQVQSTSCCTTTMTVTQQRIRMSKSQR